MSILLQDTYIRADTTANSNIATGWGAASDGNPWSSAGGTPNWKITSNEGTATNSAAVCYALLSSSTASDSDVRVRVQVTNSADQGGVILCYADNNNHYRLRLTSTSVDIVKVLSGVSTTESTASFARGANAFYWLHARMTKGVLSITAWAVSGSESIGWLATWTDPTPLAAGKTGLFTNLNNVAHTISFDSFRATDITTKSVGLRARIATQKTVSAGVRAIVVLGNPTLSVGLRLLENVQKTVSAGLRARVATQKMLSFGLRGRLTTQRLLSAGIRALVQAQQTLSVGIRALLHVSGIQGQDTFATGGRGIPNACSPASDGENWTQPLGTTPFTFNGTQGVLSGGSNGANNVFFLGNKMVADIDVTAHFSMSSTADNIGVIGRAKDTNNYYRAVGTTDGAGNWQLLIDAVVGGVAANLVTVGVDTPSAGWYVHFQIKGNSVNNLQASYWRDGEMDPGFAAIATNNQLQAIGHFGIRARVANHVDVLTVDSFLAQDPAPFPTPPAPPSPIPFSWCGATLYVAGSIQTFLEQQTITDLAGLAHGAWLRYQLKWKTVEPNADGVYNWTFLDYAVTLCNSYGINICWPIQSPPNGYLTIRATDGATVAAGTGDYASPAAWATFMAAVAARYNGTVLSPISGYPMTLNAMGWENENYDAAQPGVPNNSARDKLAGWLTLVMNASYPGIRAAGYTGRLIINAVRKTPQGAFDHIKSWELMLLTYAGGLLPAILADPLVRQDLHAYYDGRTNFDGSLVQDPTLNTYDSQGNINAPSIQLEIATLYSILAMHGAAWKLWIGETGWDVLNANGDIYASDTPVVTQAVDASYRQAMLEASRLGGVEVICQFTISPTATVKSKNLPTSPTNPMVISVQESSAPKSITQIVGSPGIYTYFAAYFMIKHYAAVYPVWPGATLPTMNVEAVFRDGLVDATFRDGKTSATFRDGLVDAVFH